jgi:hypothetical protein
MKYRKKPVVIEAWQLPRDTDETTRETPTWIVAAVLGDTLQLVGPLGKAYIKTRDGTMTAEVGDWIIKGVKGELYPCKPDIFEATYEPAT